MRTIKGTVRTPKKETVCENRKIPYSAHYNKKTIAITHTASLVDILAVYVPFFMIP